MDIVSQKTCTYLPSKSSMDSIFLVLNSKVNVISQEDVEAKCGEEKVKAVFETAKNISHKTQS